MGGFDVRFATDTEFSREMPNVEWVENEVVPHQSRSKADGKAGKYGRRESDCLVRVCGIAK